MRRPLQDCTNRVQLKLGEEKVDLPLKTKGQWKRKARLQGEVMDMNIPENSTEHHKKKDRREMNQQVELEPESPAGKRVRVEQQQESQ